MLNQKYWNAILFLKFIHLSTRERVFGTPVLIFPKSFCILETSVALQSLTSMFCLPNVLLVGSHTGAHVFAGCEVALWQ
jgi:hypothetical protein